MSVNARIFNPGSYPAALSVGELQAEMSNLSLSVPERSWFGDDYREAAAGTVSYDSVIMSPGQTNDFMNSCTTSSCCIPGRKMFEYEEKEKQNRDSIEAQDESIKTVQVYLLFGIGIWTAFFLF